MLAWVREVLDQAELHEHLDQVRRIRICLSSAIGTSPLGTRMRDCFSIQRIFVRQPVIGIEGRDEVEN